MLTTRQSPSGKVAAIAGVVPITFPLVATAASVEVEVPFPGALPGDVVSASIPSITPSGICIGPNRVQNPDKVTIAIGNFTGGNVTLGLVNVSVICDRTN